jgi:hypothetical protein
MATDCAVVCGCGGREDVVVDVRYGFDRGVEIRVRGNPPLRQLMEDRAVHLPRYGAGNVFLHSTLDRLRLRGWAVLAGRHFPPPNQFETSVRCRDIGSEKVQLDCPISPSHEHWPGKFLVGYERSLETARSLPYSRVSIRIC